MYNYKNYWEIKGREKAEEWNSIKRQFLLNELKQLKFKTVLELGCGDGQLSSLIKNFNCNLTGLDISKHRIESNQFLDKKIQLDIFDFNNEKKYDLIICSHFLLHIEPRNIKQVIKKMINLSKRYIVFLEPDPQIDLGNWEYYNFQHDYFSVLENLNENFSFISGPKNIGIFIIDRMDNGWIEV